MLIAEEEDEKEGAGELCIKSPAMFQEYWRNPKVLDCEHSHVLIAFSSLLLFHPGR